MFLAQLELLDKFGPTGVGIAAAVVIVMLFLKEQRHTAIQHRATVDSIVKDFNGRMTTRDALISKMNDEHIVARAKSAETLLQNTKEIATNTEVVRAFNSAAQQILHKLDQRPACANYRTTEE